MREGAAILIAGPTASGKSALALDLARISGGVVVNADSMQVYDGLDILTARPPKSDLDRADHRLYGHVPPTATYSVGRWREDVAALLAELRAAGRLPIVCGGTGLYFRALLGGIDDMPPIDPARRDFWRARLEEEGPGLLHHVLGRLDGEAARRIRPGDGQRILRAIEIVEATGRPLGEAQGGRGTPLVDPAGTVKLVLTPPRELLRRRIAERFEAMMARGALDEAKAFLSIPGAAAGTAGRAIGIPELGAHLSGELTLDAAIALAVTRSRQYAKRQDTWFRNQFAEDWMRADAAAAVDPDKLMDRLHHA